MTNEEFDAKWNDKYKERVDNFQNVSAPETKERLEKIEHILEEIVNILKTLTEQIKNVRPD